MAEENSTTIIINIINKEEKPTEIKKEKPLKFELPLPDYDGDQD